MYITDENIILTIMLIIREYIPVFNIIRTDKTSNLNRLDIVDIINASLFLLIAWSEEERGVSIKNSKKNGASTFIYLYPSSVPYIRFRKNFGLINNTRDETVPISSDSITIWLILFMHIPLLFNS